MMRLTLLFAALSLVACSSASEGQTSADATSVTTYVSADAYWKTGADQSAWQSMKNELVKEFDDVCGDTFCGGDYSNLTSMGLTCGVSSAHGIIHDCVWWFSGSSDLVVGSTGTIQSSIASFQCHFKPSGGVRSLMNFLNGPATAQPLRRTLSGENRSLYDVLGDCFQHPIGATPISAGTGTTYMDAPDAPPTNQDTWFAATSTLDSGFADVCGDTFCAGDYEIKSLRFACSVRGTTGTIRSCKWLFGGSYATVDSKTGVVAINTKAYRCTIPVTGKANDLATFLTQPGTPAPIDRVLPGATKSAYDDLTSCL